MHNELRHSRVEGLCCTQIWRAGQKSEAPSYNGLHTKLTHSRVEGLYCTQLTFKKQEPKLSVFCIFWSNIWEVMGTLGDSCSPKSESVDSKNLKKVLSVDSSSQLTFKKQEPKLSVVFIFWSNILEVVEILGLSCSPLTESVDSIIASTVLSVDSSVEVQGTI